MRNFRHSRNWIVAKISIHMAVMPMAHFASVLKLNKGRISSRMLAITQPEAEAEKEKFQIWHRDNSNSSPSLKVPRKACLTNRESNFPGASIQSGAYPIAHMVEAF